MRGGKPSFISWYTWYIVWCEVWQIQTAADREYRQSTVRGISMTDCHLLTEYWENRYRPLSPSPPGRWWRYLQILDSSSWQFSDIYCHITFSHTITIWGGCHIKTVYCVYFVIWLHLSLPHRRYVNKCDGHWRFRREN